MRGNQFKGAEANDDPSPSCDCSAWSGASRKLRGKGAIVTGKMRKYYVLLTVARALLRQLGPLRG